MDILYAITASIEDVLFLGGVSLVLLCICLIRRQQRSLNTVHADECGGSYSLSLVLVTPVYTLFICLIIETALVSVVKLGTLYASYSAARSAMVWLPAEVPHPEKIRLAAVHAMTPFASSLKEHIITSQGTSQSTEDNADYFAAYQLTPYATQSETYVSRKREYALQATKVTIELEADERETDLDQKPRITATVEYELPINVPGVGRIFGSKTSQPGADFYSRIITSSATLDLDSPLSKNFRLGIGYDSDYDAD